MKTIIISHYTVLDINPTPWSETWKNLAAFAVRMSARLAPMNIKLKLRKVILDDITEDTLMSGNMVTLKSEELHFEETPLEEIIMFELDYTPCPSCLTPDGTGFACRTLKDSLGSDYQIIKEEFFMDAVLRVAFKSSHGSTCGCSDCSSCASGCGDEEKGICSCD